MERSIAIDKQETREPLLCVLVVGVWILCLSLIVTLDFGQT